MSLSDGIDHFKAFEMTAVETGTRVVSVPADKGPSPPMRTYEYVMKSDCYLPGSQGPVRHPLTVIDLKLVTLADGLMANL